VIAHKARADDALLEGVKGGEIVDLRRPLVPGQKRTRPEIDEIVAEWPPHAIGQAVARLPQQIDDISDKSHGNVAAGNLIDQRRGRNRRRSAARHISAGLSRAQQALE
jgi:hypothetical protein